MLQLKINAEESQLHWLRKPTYLLGRSSVCNIRIEDASVQAVHACLKVDDKAVRLVPQEGASVWINGEAINEERELHLNELLQLGEVTMCLLDPAQEDKPQLHQPTKGEMVSEQEANPALHPDSIPTLQPDDIDATVQRPALQVTPRWRLLGLSAVLSGSDFNLVKQCVIGRAKDCNIRLGEAHLSRHHARLTVKEEGLWVEDLDSANGTFVNGRRIKEALLKSGDEISFDTLRFRVKQIEQEDVGEKTQVRPAIKTPEPGVIKEPEPAMARKASVPPAKPTGPTAIDLQREALRRQRDRRETHEQHRAIAPSFTRGGWFPLGVLALAAIFWGATSIMESAPVG